MVFNKSCQNTPKKDWMTIQKNLKTNIILLTIVLHFCWVNKNTFHCPEITTFLSWSDSLLQKTKSYRKLLYSSTFISPSFFAGDTVHQEKWPRTGSWAGPRWGQFCPKTLSKAKEEGEAVDNFDHPLDEHNTYHCPKQKGVWPPRAWPNFKISHAVCPLPRELCSGQVNPPSYILFSKPREGSNWFFRLISKKGPHLNLFT